MSQGNKPQIKMAPEPIPISNGRPTAAVEAVNNHIQQWNKSQKNMAKDVEKACALMKWILDSAHKSMNPKNQGKVEQVWVENPKFDFSQPEGKENPFLIQQYEHMYQPEKHKENSVITVAQTYLRNNEQRIRELSEHEKYLKKELQEAKKALKEGGASQEEVDDFSVSNLIDTDFLDVDSSTSFN